jgi:hypothetical protein
MKQTFFKIPQIIHVYINNQMILPTKIQYLQLKIILNENFKNLSLHSQFKADSSDHFN